MENNKILISIHFDSGDKARVIELMILRDADFSQLLDSVYYGLKKQVYQEKKTGVTDTSVLSFAECLEIFESCRGKMKNDNETGERYWTHMFASLFDRKTLEREKNHTIVSVEGSKKVERVVFFESDKEKRICDLGFISATRLIFFKSVVKRIHEINTENIIEPFDPDNTGGEVRFPKYNISSRQLQCYDTSPVEIIPPSNPPQKPKQNIWMSLLPTVLSVAVMALLRSFIMDGSGNGSMVLMSVAMGIITIITTVLTWTRQKKNYKESLDEWKIQYENYISRVITQIDARKVRDAELLRRDYPGAMALFDEVFKLNDNVFSRSPAHSDFLSVRLGMSDDVECMFEIKGSKKEEIFSPAAFELKNGRVSLFLMDPNDNNAQGHTDQYISNLPAKISESYRFMKDAPYLYSLSKIGTLGVVYDDMNGDSSDDNAVDSVLELFIRRMIFELSYYHSPENLQFVIFFPESSNQAKINDYISRYAHLPHCRDLFENRSQFVFSNKAANNVLSSMLKVMDERNRAEGETVMTPHIVFIIFDEYNLKEHAFAAYLPSTPKVGETYENKNGLTFIFAKKYKEYLPEFCNDIITLSNTPNGKCTIVPYNNKNAVKSFSCDIISKARNEGEEKRSFRMLSGIYYTRISQNRQVPSSVSLFKTFNFECDTSNVKEHLKQFISRNWGNDSESRRIFDVTKTLSVPIGLTDNDTAYLDLHEKADGPHMLVAGTTGSGKSETVISYLIGLCMRFRPDEVSMMLVDMKGGGFTKRLGSLPHVVGSVTDIDGDENNTGAEYMLKRFLVAIKSEVKRRKMIINKFPNVDSIDGYIKKCRELEAASGTPEDVLKYIRENTLSHLILVVDEFTELKRFTSENSDIDYMGEITTIARIGRSLGIHIILISQNIEGAITDDIRVNSKSRLCLKVATRQASKEMLGNDLAASPSMPGNGRAYLLVGTGSKFEYFQSAYSGVLSTENTSTDLVVTNVEKEGDYTQFYSSFEDNEEIVKKRKSNKITQLMVTVDAVCELYDDMRASGKISKVNRIFRDPLPEEIVYGADTSLL